MKRKIKLTDKTTGKIISGEITLRNIDHLKVQQTYKAKVFKPKKGKGSWKRNNKIDFD